MMHSANKLAVSSAGGLSLAIAPAADATETTGIGGDALFAVVFVLAAFAILLYLLLRNRTHLLAQALSRGKGRRRIRRVVDGARLELMPDFILPGACDGLARIDGAIHTPCGIVCIRAMHGNGMVFGGATDPQWQIVDGTRRRQFLNPVIQNVGRVNAIRRIVGDMPVTGVVVFTGTVEFPTRPAESVIHVGELGAWLRDYQANNDAAREPDAAWLSLLAAARTDAASHKDFEAQLSFG